MAISFNWTPVFFINSRRKFSSGIISVLIYRRIKSQRITINPNQRDYRRIENKGKRQINKATNTPGATHHSMKSNEQEGGKGEKKYGIFKMQHNRGSSEP